MSTIVALPLTLSETEFKLTVVDYARLRRWKATHFRPAMNRRGAWSTPLEGDPGFPDLVLARDGVVIIAELKTQHGPIRPAQKNWLVALGEFGRLWRPSDWPQIVEELR